MNFETTDLGKRLAVDSTTGLVFSITNLEKTVRWLRSHHGQFRDHDADSAAQILWQKVKAGIDDAGGPDAGVGQLQGLMVVHWVIGPSHVRCPTEDALKYRVDFFVRLGRSPKLRIVEATD